MIIVVPPIKVKRGVNLVVSPAQDRNERKRFPVERFWVFCFYFVLFYLLIFCDQLFRIYEGDRVGSYNLYFERWIF